MYSCCFLSIKHNELDLPSDTQNTPYKQQVIYQTHFQAMKICFVNCQMEIKLIEIPTLLEVVLNRFNKFVKETRRSNPEWTIQRHWQEEFENTKGVIRIRKSKKDNTMANRKRTKDKQRFTKHQTENKSSSKTSPIKIRGDLRCSGTPLVTPAMLL